jgi:hypothetical protein
VADPWALLVTNVGTSNTTITIEQNNAEFGSPPSLAITTTAQLAPGEVRQSPAGLPRPRIPQAPP